MMAMTPFQLFLQKEKFRRTNQEKRRATFNEQQAMIKELHHVRTARYASVNETNDQRLTITNFIGSRSKLYAIRSKSNSLTKRNKSVIDRFNTTRYNVFLTSPSGVVRRWRDTSHDKYYIYSRRAYLQRYRPGSLSPSSQRVKSERGEMNLTVKGVHKRGVYIQDVYYYNEYNKLLKMYGVRFNKRAEEKDRPIIKHKKIHLFRKDPNALTPWYESIDYY